MLGRLETRTQRTAALLVAAHGRIPPHQPLTADALPLLVTRPGREIRVHIPGPVDHIRNVEVAARTRIVRVAQEDHIAAVGDAAIAGAKLGSVAAHEPRQARQPLAILGELVDECFGNRAATAFALM